MSKQDLHKIKASFEGQELKAPEQSWSDIGAGLDAKVLDEKIKASFESAKTTAPVFDFSLVPENPIDGLVKESFEQTQVSAPAGGWARVLDGLEIKRSWEAIADKIVVKSNTWKTVVAAACLVLLLSVIPNSVKDGEFMNTALIDFNQKNSNTPIADKTNLPASLDNDLRFGLLAQTEVNNSSMVNQSNHAEQLASFNNHHESEITGLNPTGISLLSQSIEAKEMEMVVHPIQKPVQIEKSKWSLGIYGGVNRTWIHDNLSRDAFDKHTTVASKFVVGDMYGISAGYELKNGYSLTANAFKATSRNKIGMYKHGNYIFQTNRIKFYKLNVLLGKRLWNINEQMNIAMKAGPSLAYVSANETKIEDKIVNFNEGYKRFNLAANVQLGFNYTFSNFVLETGVNSELGIRNLFEGTVGLPAESNFTNNMDLGIYTSLRYRF